jgi:hypothetical protein
VANDTVEHKSTLSDSLLRQLMAVGQADIVVGLPTLDNASTVLDVVRAVHLSFTRDFPRLRSVMINSDGGSTDGTPELIRSASVAETGMVQTSHSLRTLHRVVAPYHGLPGKVTALRAVFAAVELTQAKVLVVIDPNGPARTPERVTEMIQPLLRGDVEFLTSRYPRHPRDGVLVTQLVRPVIRALYGAALYEPLASEFACSGRFVSHCLEQSIWQREMARFTIDLWLHTEAIARGFSMGQIWRPPAGTTSPRPPLRETVRQIVVALAESLRAHESFWTRPHDLLQLATWGRDGADPPDPPPWDYKALGLEARNDIDEIRPLLREVLEPGLLSRLVDAVSSPALRADEELWVRSVYAFATAARRPSANVEQLAGVFVPIYLWRAASFMACASKEPETAVEVRLESLCQAFERLKPVLVDSWSTGV